MRKPVLLFILLFAAMHSSAQMTARVVRDSLFIPWELIYGPDDHIWFTQKNGYICRMEPASGAIDTLYHETNVLVINEGGMLGMALHPSFPAEPYVYVAYVYNNGSANKERVVRYTYSGNTLQSPLVIFDNINASGIHNGCRLMIVGDKLFISTGDASNASVAQDVNALNGKILRVNLDGSIPADNPLAGKPVWSWGHRNAQGMVFANNRIYSSEHGPNNDDEMNVVLKGRNYGWPNVEGFCNMPSEVTFCTDSNVVEPLMAWTPTLAVSGIDYYDHPMFTALQQSILMTTLKDEHLYQLQLNATFDSITSATIIPEADFGRLRDICISPEGRIYLSTSNSNAGGTGTFTDKIIELYDPSFTNSVPGNFHDNRLSIAPNPANEVIFIRLPEGTFYEPCDYTLSSADGRIVDKNTCTGAVTTVSMKDLASGMYHVCVHTRSGKTFTGKVLKQF